MKKRKEEKIDDENEDSEDMDVEGNQEDSENDNDNENEPLEVEEEPVSAKEKPKSKKTEVKKEEVKQPIEEQVNNEGKTIKNKAQELLEDSYIDQLNTKGQNKKRILVVKDKIGTMKELLNDYFVTTDTDYYNNKTKFITIAYFLLNLVFIAYNVYYIGKYIVVNESFKHYIEIFYSLYFVIIALTLVNNRQIITIRNKFNFHNKISIFSTIQAFLASNFYMFLININPYVQSNYIYNYTVSFIIYFYVSYNLSGINDYYSNTMQMIQSNYAYKTFKYIVSDIYNKNIYKYFFKHFIIFIPFFLSIFLIGLVSVNIFILTAIVALTYSVIIDPYININLVYNKLKKEEKKQKDSEDSLEKKGK